MRLLRPDNVTLQHDGKFGYIGFAISISYYILWVFSNL
jgi:hypothetical protein